MDKKQARLRRARKTRIKLRQLSKLRLSVHKTSQHIYAQIIAEDASKVLVSASSLEHAFSEENAQVYGGNIQSAVLVGKMIATRAVEKGISVLSFDRSGFKYHGRIKHLADSAREHGLKF